MGGANRGWLLETAGDRGETTEGPPRGRAFCGGRARRRSGDPSLFRRVLFQLSYPTASHLFRRAGEIGGPDGI